MKNTNICKFNITQSSDLVCNRFVYETTDCQESPTIADTHNLGLVIKGSGRLTLNSKCEEISRGDMFLIFKGDNFSIDSASDLEYSYISFGGRRADELTERLDVFTDSRVFDGYEDLIDFWSDCLHKADSGNLDLFSESVLLYSLAHFNPKPKSQNGVITKVLAYTGENFTDVKLSLSSMAQELGYDAKYLSFQFKKKKGITYTSYLRNLRLRHAAFLFEQGVISVKNAAIMSGFTDSLYFSKIFKKEFDKSPREYIEDLKKNIDTRSSNSTSDD